MKILLVDDHVLVRQGVRRLLMIIPNVEIFEAATSFDALNLFRQQQPEIVVLDISLAGSSGRDAKPNGACSSSGVQPLCSSP